MTACFLARIRIRILTHRLAGANCDTIVLSGEDPVAP